MSKCIIRKTIALMLVCVAFAALLTSCKAKEETIEATQEPAVATEPVQTDEPSPTATDYSGFRNPLTGEPTENDYTSQRPYAVMINNISVARPQSGVAQADIIYEALAEGGITRLMAVFQDISDVGVIGSVRSARPYYIDLAQGLDAIYIHAGGSDDAYSTIYSSGIDHVDGVNGDDYIYFRDEDRMENMGYEHSLMIETSLIDGFISDSTDFDTQHRDSYQNNLKFIEDGTPAGGQSAQNITVHFGTDKTTGFEYNTAEKVYYVTQDGESFIDCQDDSRVTMTNVVVLYASVYTVDDYGRLQTELTGTGTGYYMCGGKYVDINWSKDDSLSPFVYTLADGSEVNFGVGTSYVCIVPTDSTVEIS